MSLLRARGLAVGYPAPKGRARRPRPASATERAPATSAAPAVAAPAAAPPGLAPAAAAGARLLFSDLELEVSEGRFIVLLGPNGAGKSTLLRSLTGMQPLLGGEVELLGSPLAQLEARERARRLALVLTERFDSGWFEVFDIVAFGRFPHEDFREEAGPEDRRIIGEALRAVGMEAFAGRLFAELSDGEKQKVLIARALAQASPLIVLDEPTAFLDAPARSEIFHLLKSQAREGKGVLMSTHEVDLALREADEVWLVDRGRGLVIGSPEELVLSGAIGSAFDGPDLAFDPASARFLPRRRGPQVGVAVSGEDAVGLAWTLRLVERLGLGLEAGPEGYAAEIRVLSRRRWELRAGPGGAARELEGLAELEAFLRSLL